MIITQIYSFIKYLMHFYQKKIDLTYKNPTDEHIYQDYVSSLSIKLYKYFFLYVVMAIFTAFLRSIYYQNYFSLWRLLFLSSFLLIAFLLIKTKSSLIHKHSQIVFCFIIIFMYIIHVRVFFPILLAHFDGHYIFYLGSGLETLRVFIYLSKMRWYYGLGTNIIINIYNLWDLTSTTQINKFNLFSFIFPIVMVNTLPIITYFQEQNFRFFFLQNLNYQRDLLSFETLINEILPNQIVVMNGNRTNLLFCNHEMQRFHKKTDLEEILLKIKSDYVEINTEKSLYSLLLTISVEELQKTAFIDYEIKVRKEGQIEEYIYFNAKIGKIHWQHQKAFLILLTDISATKDVERLKEVDAYKDRLLATVSHDLRTPLNGMMGIIEITSEQIEDKELKKNLKIALRCSNLLLFMINDILDFSLISNGKLRLSFYKTKLVDLTKEVTSMLKFQCSKKGISLICEISDRVKEIEITTDPRRLQQILLNLLSNAFKFTYQGYIKLKIDLGKTGIKFQVEDTGVGIKKTEISKLFQLFGKLDQTNPAINKSGIGLGLVISKHLLSNLCREDKEFEVDSEYGIGTKFSFELPMDSEEEQINEENLKKDYDIEEKMKLYKKNRTNIIDLRHIDINSTNSSPFIGSISLSSSNKLLTCSHKFLLVDDDQINLFVIGKYLESFDIYYKTANNGVQCLNILKKEKGFTLIIMDCNMPLMNGFQASILINKLQKNKEIEKIPILALTANTSVKDIEECKASFMDNYLAKPVSKKQLKETLEEMLNMKIKLDKKLVETPKVKKAIQ